MKEDLIFNNKKIKVVILDMDGTLIDSTGMWADIDKEFFKKRGINKVPADFAKEVVHLGLEKGAEMAIERYGFVNDTVEGIIQEWKDASINQYENIIQLKEKAIEFLEFLSKKDVILTLATANDKSLYEPCLKRLGIGKYFDTITDVNKVKEGKSSPKIYDSVISKHGAVREETLIFEDSLIALKTAYSSGFNVVAVDDASTRYATEEKKQHSHLFIETFADFINKY